MTDFKILQQAVQKQFKYMVDNSTFLYTTNVEKNELWDLYLDSFPPGTNGIYRERREHDCSSCKNFINNIGGVVAIINNEVVSLWDFDIDDETYALVVKALSKHMKSKHITNIYVNETKKVGHEKDHENINGEIVTWSHFHIELPNKFIKLYNGDKYKAKYFDIKNVFQRSLEEIKPEAIDTVLELISSNSIYRGQEWKEVLKKFKTYQTKYLTLNQRYRNIYVYDKAVNIDVSVGKLKNHSIGNLLMDISNGLPLDDAVRKFESMVAPANYKRPKPIFSKKMLEDAKKKVEELGYMDSLQRRHAILEDISVNNILFANRNVTNKLQGGMDVFEEMKEEVPVNPKNFNRAEEVTVDKFIKDVLPNTQKIEVLVESKHKKNMVSLIAPSNANAKTMFKWNNNFSWAYTGNVTDSMKENVKKAGGKVNGVLRFSIQWNDENVHNKSDYDAHCIEPSKYHIFYSNKKNRATTGNLDVDIIEPKKNVPAVENITWSEKAKMQKGTYQFFVRNYTKRSGCSGFKAEIEFNGEIHSFTYSKPLKKMEDVQVAEVNFDGNNFTINKKLDSTMSSIDLWGIKTNQFVPVSVMMYSPNYWNEQKGIGNKHFFFMLNNCVNDEEPNGFFNEYLNNELMQHKKVFEALGSKMKVDKIDNQLSGIGFSDTKRNDIIVRVEGQTKRILKIKI